MTSLRKEAGYTQPKVSELLAQEGIDIRTAGISKWEKGLTQPNASQFLVLCKLYGVTDVMGTFMDTPTPLDALNDEGKRLVDNYVRILVASRLYDAQPPEKAARLLPLYRLAASAGTGQILDGDDYELTEVPEHVPEAADFGVRIAGDSMEPEIKNGATVWVERRETLPAGRIGVFYYNGQAYCKRLECREGEAYLVSLNPAYAPICTDAALGFKVFGEVVAVS